MPSLPYQFPAPRSMPTRQVYDFPSVIAYTNYSQCVSRQPGRAYSQPFEVWKNRAFFPYTESIADATKGECRRAAVPGAPRSAFATVLALR